LLCNGFAERVVEEMDDFAWLVGSLDRFDAFDA
jgi:hypothetical protein